MNTFVDTLQSQLPNNEKVLLSVSFHDSISCVRFCQDKSCNRILTSSWDRSVQLNDVDGDRLLSKFHHDAPVLSCCFMKKESSISGGVDTIVKRFDFGSETSTTIGKHQAGVRCVQYSEENDIVVSGGWDKNINLWDVRSSDGTSPVQSITLPEKVFAMDMQGSLLLVGTADESIVLYDIRKIQEPIFNRSSSLQYQTRSLRLFPDGKGFAVGCTAGRVVVDYVLEGERKPFKFKCHRSADEHIFPINAISFHPIYGTFVTGGGDETVCTWDPENQRRLSLAANYSNSIMSLDYNATGEFLAIAVSYGWESGEDPIKESQNAIVIRTSKEAQVKPKPKK